MGVIKRAINYTKNKLYQFKRKTDYNKELKKINARLRKTERAAIVVGSVEYANLGDQAICLSQVKFIQRLLPVFEIRDSLFKSMPDKIKKMIRNEDIIVIPGGGNMGDIWKDDEMRRRKIISDFPDNKIIIFPQTFDYSNTLNGKQSLEESIKIYSRHKNLIICAREEYSFNKIKKYYPKNKVVLVPDIVLVLQVDFSLDRENCVLCFRNDVEKSIDADTIKKVKKIIGDFGLNTSCTDTVSAGNLDLRDREAKIMDKIYSFASSKLVITDRLHAMIFCAITNTPCMVFSNSNYKIKGVYEKWLYNINFIKFYEEFDEKAFRNDIFFMLNISGEANKWSPKEYFEDLVREFV